MPKNDPYKIVLLETDQACRDHLKSVMLRWGYKPLTFDNELILFDNIMPLGPDLVISGNLATENTFSFINSLKMINCDLPVLLISGDRHIQDFIDSNGLSNVKVARKDISHNEIKALIRQALTKSEYPECDALKPLIVGNSPEMVKLKKLIPKINQTKEAVFIKGEPGTGKELFARVIHKHSERKSQPFIKVNAARLPFRLLGDELFGSNESGLSDFPRHKDGALAAAQTSTLFIKEIGVIPEFLQAKLLQLMGNGIHSAFTNSNKKKMDVRIIASTTKDIEALTKKNLFRKDLFYRLNVLVFAIPPLRNRVADIPALIDFFCYKYCIEFGRSCFRVSSRTKERFCEYHWPGNVRELENAVKNIVLIGEEENLMKHPYPPESGQYSDQAKIQREINGLVNGFADIGQYLLKTNNYSLKLIRGQIAVKTERNLIRKALELTNWNRKKAAALLEISYKSLLTRIKLYNI